jgi:hypothetical protein
MILVTFMRLHAEASSADGPVVDDRASFGLGAEDAALEVVPRVASVLVTGAAKSRIKIHRDLGRSQDTERPAKIQEKWSIAG